jgi:hypothetical protein
VTRLPAHAGRLRPTERFVFAMVFALMAAFVVAVTTQAARFPVQLTGPATAAGSRTVPAGDTGSAAPNGGRGHAVAKAGLATPPIQPASARLDGRLAAALGKVLTAHHGELAVGVIDVTTGQQALYHGGRQFRSAGIVTADILAALLIGHQQAGTPVSSQQAFLATAMMDNGSQMAADDLWRTIGGGNGVESLNHLLGLSHTSTASGDQWDLASTTVADQLALLTDLTTAHSVLPGAARGYVLGLMASDATGQRWGVVAAATRGTGYAVDNSGLADGPLWDVNSIGVVKHAGQVLLIAVLSSHSRSEAAGLSMASAAALAAADVVTKT